MKNSFSCKRPLPGYESISYMSLPEAELHGAGAISRLPYSLRVLVELMLRTEDGHNVTANDIARLIDTHLAGTERRPDSVSFFPSRILFQDSAGLPVLADIAALNEDAAASGKNVPKITLKADLIVDHSIEVDAWGSADAKTVNLDREFERNDARYRFLRWCQSQYPWLSVVPPGAGICHQINLENLARVVVVQETDQELLAGCDAVLGTDSHTTMINSLSVFGWGVGGLEATAALLGEPTVIPFPEVIGVHLRGRLKPGVLASDLALSLTAFLRHYDTVQKFVEYFGDGLENLSIPDRATVANMAPEYGATMGFFPADVKTLEYLRRTGRPQNHVNFVKAFLEGQNLLYSATAEPPVYTRVLEFDLETVEPTVAGPDAPNQKLKVSEVPLTAPSRSGRDGLDNGDVVLAAITSCTNTSNPNALTAAGLLAEKAVALGLEKKPWIKASFAPGSQSAAQLLTNNGLQRSLDKLGFNIVGFGCTTCMGNSGPLDKNIADAIAADGVAAAAVLSGNRNFTGRIHPLCRLTYLTSPMLVVAYALAGSVHVDLINDPLAVKEGRSIYLRDILPTESEINQALQKGLRGGAEEVAWRDLLAGSAHWQHLNYPSSKAFPWEGISGFIRKPPFLAEELRQPLRLEDLRNARILVLLGDNVTTDHISPVSRILPGTAAGDWLQQQGVIPAEFGSFSARRLNHEVMLRGGFANPRIKNLLLGGKEGGSTVAFPSGEAMPIHVAAATYAENKVPMVVVAGARYGAGSARDWAAKVTRLLGIRAVLAESFERIHRTNLIAMGVLPLRISHSDKEKIRGDESLSILGNDDALNPGGEVILRVDSGSSGCWECKLLCDLESRAEAGWMADGGIFTRALKMGSPVSLG